MIIAACILVIFLLAKPRFELKTCSDNLFIAKLNYIHNTSYEETSSFFIQIFSV